MTGDERRGDRAGALRAVAVLVAIMWGTEVVDQIVGGDLDALGIEPRDGDGLVGVAAAPFLHADFGHLAANTVPFAAMGALIALSGLARVLAVTAIVALVSGLGTWLVAPAGTLHIGASGVVFGYGTYLLARGIFSGSLAQIAVAALVGALFGGALLGGLLPQEGISWQAHLFGAIGGVAAARALAPDRSA